MHKGRLEAFSDGVLAIIITIMVLEMKVPHGTDLAALKPLLPVFLSYVLSFAYIGIYWNNHHHLFQAVKHVRGTVLLANLHLLFWLSLLPFVTGWMGENHFSPTTVGLYGGVLIMAAIAFLILVKTLIASHGTDSTLAIALGDNKKGTVSIFIYVIGTALTLWNSWISIALFTGVAIMWLVPDSRIEKHLSK